MLLNTTNE